MSDTPTLPEPDGDEWGDRFAWTDDQQPVWDKPLRWRRKLAALAKAREQQ